MHKCVACVHNSFIKTNKNIAAITCNQHCCYNDSAHIKISDKKCSMQKKDNAINSVCEKTHSKWMLKYTKFIKTNIDFYKTRTHARTPAKGQRLGLGEPANMADNMHRNINIPARSASATTTSVFFPGQVFLFKINTVWYFPTSNENIWCVRKFRMQNSTIILLNGQ